jgi:NADH-ubiquinone oxidoreductase chain 1
MFIIFLIGGIAETNRAPFDLAEAESELVSGFMTEHAAVIFVFFFLAEYASIVLICILLSIFFLGGYIIDTYILTLFKSVFYINNNTVVQVLVEGIISNIVLGIKACSMVFIFI